MGSIKKLNQFGQVKYGPTLSAGNQKPYALEPRVFGLFDKKPTFKM
jgi:hypothetical protein